MTQDITVAMAAVRKWIGNPVSLRLLRYVTAHDRCGSRLSNAIDHYLGRGGDLCWRCRIAGGIVGWTLGKGGEIFSIGEKDMKETLANPIFKRGLINVIEGIARYGITMPQVVNAPFLVVWDFTHRCNLKCRHCYQDAQAALPDELTTQESLGLIDQMADAGVVAVAFSGGEPLMRRDFYEVAAHAHGKGMYVSLATNGTLITPEVAGRLKETGVDYVEMSIDGKDASSHDAFRGIPGAFDRTVQGIRNCVGEGLFTCIACTVTRDNLAEVPEIYDLGARLGVTRMMYFNFIPTGRGAGMVDGDISPEEREELLNYLLAKNGPAGKGPEVLSTAPQFARVAMEGVNGREEVCLGHFYHNGGVSEETKALAAFIGGCGAGRLYCCVEPEGTVQPCVFMPIPVGNVRERPFLDIWHGSVVLAKLRDRSSLKGACGSCGNRYICGGCRARAWAYFHDIHGPDPGCIRNQAYWDALCSEAGRTQEAHRAVPPDIIPSSQPGKPEPVAAVTGSRR
jgi:radical SAM protein with 4Fe4S-binding SPASM domain